MRITNAIIKKIDRFNYKIALVYEDGSQNELPSAMSLHTASEVQKLFRNKIRNM